MIKDLLKKKEGSGKAYLALQAKYEQLKEDLKRLAA
jgi:hypothetical protein